MQVRLWCSYPVDWIGNHKTGSFKKKGYSKTGQDKKSTASPQGTPDNSPPALPKLNELAHKIALYIIDNPGKKGNVIANYLNEDAGTVRRILSQKLYPYGFKNDRTGDGYFPTKDKKKIALIKAAHVRACLPL